MSLADRYRQKDCSHLEEGILRGRSSLGGRRTLPGGNQRHNNHDRARSRIQVSTSSMRHLFMLLLACALMAGFVRAQDVPAQTDASQEPTATFKSNVKLVSVFTTVVNKRGAPV